MTVIDGATTLVNIRKILLRRSSIGSLYNKLSSNSHQYEIIKNALKNGQQISHQTFCCFKTNVQNRTISLKNT